MTEETKTENWIDVMVERLHKIAEIIKFRIIKGDNRIDIVKDIDTKFILKIFNNILNGNIKLNDKIELSDNTEEIRKSLEYKLWRKSVFERDNYTCQICLKSGNKLNADHIKPFKHFPELRLDLNNGRTLCVECHRKTDTYGRRYKLAI